MEHVKRLFWMTGDVYIYIEAKEKYVRIHDQIITCSAPKSYVIC